MDNASSRSLRLSGMRRMIADKMQQSLRETAQVSYHAEADASELVAARNAWREAGTRVGYEDLIIAALIRALRKHPEFNAVANGAEAKISEALHVSIAIALPNGLVAPAIFDAQTKSQPEILAARQDLVTRARTGKLTIKEMTGGTFTVTNLGISRVRFFTPIINHPQLAILGLGPIAPRPWVGADGTLVVRPVLALSLTTDHRFIDGEPSGAFLTTLCEILEAPGAGAPPP